jgi:ketosteroid isomerase-like protein
MRKTFTAVAVAAATLADPTVAADIDTVRAFYSDILTDPAGTTADRYFELFSPDVVSIPTPPGRRGCARHAQHGGLPRPGRARPDLGAAGDHRTGDGRFVVRGLATGTPVGPFFGVDPATGKSFEIMSIDIVTVEDGLITHIYHLEDWTGAVAQLTAE